MKNTIIKEFELLVKIGNASGHPNFKWKLINYKKVIDILTRSKEEINTTGKALEILRADDMRFINEKQLPYKSKILIYIEEIIKNGFLKETKDNENDPKVKLIDELLQLPEIGPVKAEKLYQLGIRSIEDLHEKPELLNRKQLIGLKYYKHLNLRIPRDEMDQWNDTLSKITQTVTQTIKSNSKTKTKLINMELVGSYRRGHTDSGDVDFCISVSKISPLLMNSIISSLIAIGITSEDNIISKGNKKSMLIGKITSESIFRHIDIFIFSKEEYPFALMFSTGSAQFNIRLRKHALSYGWSLSDKGFKKNNSKGENPTQEEIVLKINKLNIETEEDIFHFLNLKYISPENRFPNAQLEIYS